MLEQNWVLKSRTGLVTCSFIDVIVCVSYSGCVYAASPVSSRSSGGNHATACCWTQSSWFRCWLLSIMQCKFLLISVKISVKQFFMLTLLKSKAQRSPVCRFSCFYFVFILKKITAAAKSCFPLFIVTSLLLTAGLKIISLKDPDLYKCQHVQNSFRIYITVYVLLFFFLEVAFGHSPKGRNCIVGEGDFAPCGSSYCKADYISSVTAQPPRWIPWYIRVAGSEGRMSARCPRCTVVKQNTASGSGSSSRCGCRAQARASAALHVLGNLALIRDTLGFRIICLLKL